MAFIIGQSGNPSGRPKGAGNKINTRLRDLISEFLVQNFADIILEFGSLKGKDKVRIYTDLLPYVLPKLQSMSSDIDIEKLSDEQLDVLFEKIMQSSKP